MENHARAAVDTGKASGKTFEEVQKDMLENLVSGAFAIPAAVAEISRLQQRGYPLVYVPKVF